MTSNANSNPTSIPNPTPDDLSAQLQIHRGAIDQTTITTQPPTRVMQNVHAMLLALGVGVQTESTFRFRCIRPSKASGEEDNRDNVNTEAFADTDAAHTTAFKFADLDGEDSISDGGGLKSNDKNPVDEEEDEEEGDEEPKTPTQAHPQLPPSSQSPPSPSKPPCTLYGPTTSDDPAGEVRFSIELTKLAGLSDTYSLDIRRLKGHLRSYKFIYDTLRDHAELNR